MSAAGRSAVLLAVVAAGCATRGDVEDLMIEHQTIRQRQDDLRAQMDQLAQNVTQLLQQMRADFQADLGAVRQQMAAVEAALRGTESRIENLRQFRPNPTPYIPQPVPGDTTGAVMPAVDDVALYNGAITDYQQGRLDLARQGFEEYLRLFPRGLSAADAQYWLGIIAYDEERYDGAIDLLQEVPRRYPDSGKAPLALRKMGDAYRALGEEERAAIAYRTLIDRYPNSTEAEAARREIEN
ncbi:MAG TPA: tetratricopeptide repeat protein [Gemmatimonadota bacterium]|nr:tetratricopeptide repeat protein [Gemmatimonadota bacterium]